MSIKAEELNYHINKQYILSNINFEVVEQITMIIGENGSGKSTLINLLNGLIIPSDGQLAILGHNINNQSKLNELKEIQRQVGIVYQFSDMQIFSQTVELELLYGIKNFKLDVKQAKDEIEKYFNCFDLPLELLHKSPFHLSGGQKKKIAIISMLLIKPEILILDEPTIGLDPGSKIQLMNILKTIASKENNKIIIIEHDFNLIYQYADQIIELHNGSIKNILSNYLYFKDKYINKKLIYLPDELKVLNIINESSQVYDAARLSSDIDLFIKEKIELLSKN